MSSDSSSNEKHDTAKTTVAIQRHDGDSTTVVDATVLNDMIERLNNLQHEVNKLKKRNFEKDRGKEFESSYTRVLFLMAVTYWTLFGYMALIIQSPNPFLDAIVPTVGFNISTWSLPYVKEWWIQARHYYVHGESESASMRRLVVDQDNTDVENGSVSQSATTQKNNESDQILVQVPTMDTEFGSPSSAKNVPK